MEYKYPKLLYAAAVCMVSMIVIFVSVTIVISGGTGHTHKDKGEHNMRVPAQYKDKKNLFWSDIESIVAGSMIYKEKCAKCHGTNGKGDGPLAKSMGRKPMSFEDSTHMSAMNDDYLFWRTMDGGQHAPFKSSMPAFKEILSEEEVWQVLSYAHAFSHRHLLVHEHGEGKSSEAEEKHSAKGHGH